MYRNIFAAALSFKSGCAAIDFEQSVTALKPVETPVSPLVEYNINVRTQALNVLKEIEKRDDLELVGLTLGHLLGSWTHKFTIESESGLPLVLKGNAYVFADDEYCHFTALLAGEEAEFIWSAYNGASYWSEYGSFTYSANPNAWSFSPEEKAKRKEGRDKNVEKLEGEINHLFPSVCRKIYDVTDIFKKE